MGRDSLKIKDENLETYKVQIVTSLYPKYRAGEIVSVEGKMSFGEIVLLDIKNYSSSFNTIDRNKNLGMCNDCWDKISNKKDNNELYFAYINNFRLKRKSTYSKSEFKKVLNNIKI